MVYKVLIFDILSKKFTYCCEANIARPRAERETEMKEPVIRATK